MIVDVMSFLPCQCSADLVPHCFPLLPVLPAHVVVVLLSLSLLSLQLQGQRVLALHTAGQPTCVTHSRYINTLTSQVPSKSFSSHSSCSL